MKRILPVFLILIFVVFGAVFLYPRLRERTKDPEVKLSQAEKSAATTAATDEPAATTAKTTAGGTAAEAEPSTEKTSPDTSGTERTSTAETNSASEEERTEAPDFKVFTVDGEAVQYKDLVGDKPVLINYWASWCPPCRGEMPDLQKLYDEFSDRMDFLFINSTDGVRETESKAKAYFKANDFTMPMYLDSEGEAAKLYSVRSLPTTILIDADGYLIGGIPGALSEAQFRQVFKETLDLE